MKSVNIIPYERIVFPKNYFVLFWLFIGIIHFGLQEVVIRSFKESGLFWTRLMFTLIVLSGLPITYILIAKSLKPAIKTLTKIINIPTKNLSLWSEQKIYDVFSLRTRFAKIAVFCLYVAVMAILIGLDSPYQSNILSIILMLMLMQPVWLIGVHSAFIAFSLLRFLVQLTNFDTKNVFLLPPSPSIQPLISIYSRATFAALFLYLLHLWALRLSPYYTIPQIIGWVTFAGFFPLAGFIFLVTQSYKIVRAIKYTNINIINERIQDAYEKFHHKPTTENAQTLETLIRIQKEIENEKALSLGFEGFLTFFATLVIPIIQSVITVLDVTNK